MKPSKLRSSKTSDDPFHGFFGVVSSEETSKLLLSEMKASLPVDIYNIAVSTNFRLVDRNIEPESKEINIFTDQLVVEGKRKWKPSRKLQESSDSQIKEKKRKVILQGIIPPPPEPSNNIQSDVIAVKSTPSYVAVKTTPPVKKEEEEVYPHSQFKKKRGRPRKLLNSVQNFKKKRGRPTKKSSSFSVKFTVPEIRKSEIDSDILDSLREEEKQNYFCRVVQSSLLNYSESTDIPSLVSLGDQTVINPTGTALVGTKIPQLKSKLTKLPGHIVCGICGIIKYYAYILRSKKFGTFSCSACKTFIIKLIRLVKLTNNPNPLRCMKDSGTCFIGPTTRKCEACWLKLCFAGYSFSLTLKKKLNKLLSEDENLSAKFRPPYRGEILVSNEEALSKPLFYDPEEEESIIEDNTHIVLERLPGNWTKKAVRRQGGKTKGHWDVYLITPCQKRLRSEIELNSYIVSGESSVVDKTIINFSLPNSTDKIEAEILNKEAEPRSSRRDRKISRKLLDSLDLKKINHAESVSQIIQKQTLQGCREDVAVNDHKVVKRKMVGRPKKTEFDDLLADVVPIYTSDKPPYAYVTLIAMALKFLPKQTAPISLIFNYLKKKFPYYSRASVKKQKWQSAIRYNLSLSKYFTQIDGQWQINLEKFSSSKYQSELEEKEKIEKNSNIKPSSKKQPSVFDPSAILGFADYWQLYDPQSAIEQGQGMITTKEVNVYPLCFLCCSKGTEDNFIYCAACCEPFHIFCLDIEETPPKNKDMNWICRRCIVCQICGSPTNKNYKKCHSCTYTYHEKCLTPSQRKLLQEDLAWLCSYCLQCESCGKSDVSHFSDSIPLCSFCCFQKKHGNYCRLCEGVYDENDYETDMMECSKCGGWIHSKCEELDYEKYQILSYLPDNVEYICKKCHGEEKGLPPPYWITAIKGELDTGISQILKQIKSFLNSEKPRLPLQDPKNFECFVRLKNLTILSSKNLQINRLALKSYGSLLQFHQDIKALNLSSDRILEYYKFVKKSFPWFNPEHPHFVTPSLFVVDPVEYNDHSYSAQSCPRNLIFECFKLKNKKEDDRICEFCYNISEDETSGRLIFYRLNEFVHVNCTLWSSEVYEEVDGGLHNVTVALNRAVKLKCSHCKKKGASIGCCTKNCSAVFHFSCGLESGATYKKDTTVYCFDHKHKHSFKEDETDFCVKRTVTIDNEQEIAKRKKKLIDLRKVNFRVGNLQLESLGNLNLEVSDKPDILIPVGFSVSKLYWSIKNPRKMIPYKFKTCIKKNASMSRSSNDFVFDHSNDKESKEFFEKDLQALNAKSFTPTSLLPPNLISQVLKDVSYKDLHYENFEHNKFSESSSISMPKKLNKAVKNIRHRRSPSKKSYNTYDENTLFLDNLQLPSIPQVDGNDDPKEDSPSKKDFSIAGLLSPPSVPSDNNTPIIKMDEDNDDDIVILSESPRKKQKSSLEFNRIVSHPTPLNYQQLPFYPSNSFHHGIPPHGQQQYFINPNFIHPPNSVFFGNHPQVMIPETRKIYPQKQVARVQPQPIIPVALTKETPPASSGTLIKEIVVSNNQSSIGTQTAISKPRKPFRVKQSNQSNSIKIVFTKESASSPFSVSDVSAKVSPNEPFISEASKILKSKVKKISKPNLVFEPEIIQSKEPDLWRPHEKEKEHRIIFEVTSEEGFLAKSGDANFVWMELLDAVQEARIRQSMKPIPSSFLQQSGLQMLGLTHSAIAFLIEQFPEVPVCSNYVPKHSEKEEKLPENPNGCARTEVYKGRSPLDMFSWLASKHRKRPQFIESESNSSDKSSSRRATSLDLPMAMRYRHLAKNAKEAVGVFRSGIHGRGIYCKREIASGEMVIEYTGEEIRGILTDKREKYYDSKGIGCYMFKIDDDTVIDATMNGNGARFINHCCDPNCYSKIVDILGKKHIIIFALRTINPGEELTYDYKFPIEDVKIPCTCGKKKCKKYMN